MKFKYEQFLRHLPNCPPAEYKQRRLMAYRFVFADPEHPHNFLPVLLIHPKRVRTKPFRHSSMQCKGYALSLYDNLEHAQQQYAALLERHPNIHRSIGTHIAEGRIEEKDGVVSDIGKDGHFSLHEFEHTTLKTTFHVVMEVYDGTYSRITT